MAGQDASGPTASAGSSEPRAVCQAEPSGLPVFRVYEKLDAMPVRKSHPSASCAATFLQRDAAPAQHPSGKSMNDIERGHNVLAAAM